MDDHRETNKANVPSMSPDCLLVAFYGCLFGSGDQNRRSLILLDYTMIDLLRGCYSILHEHTIDVVRD